MPIFEEGMTDGRRADLFSQHLAETYNDYIKTITPHDEFKIPTNDENLQFLLKTYPESLAEKMIKSAVITAVATVKSEGDFTKKFKLFEEYKDLKISIDCEILVKMHEITPKMEGKRIKFNAIINGLSDKKTYYTSALFECRRCEGIVEVKHDEIYHTRIPKCPECRIDMFIDKERSETASIRRVILEEPIEESIFSNPQRYMGIITGDDVHAVSVGQRKKITGIFRSVIKETKDKMLGENDIMIDIKEMFDMDEKRETLPTEEEVIKLKEEAKSPDFLNKVVGSFTDKIGLHDEKLAILLSLAKGCITEVVKRDDIHVLLMGNPSVAKSELIQFAHSITPRSYSTSGENVSKVGLRGGIEQTDGYPVFVAGALSSANGSHLFIDELDKIEKGDLGALMTSMEQQFIEYDKIIHIKTPADTSIIAGANPKTGYYDYELNLQQNFNLPFTLQTRFDLIFFIKSSEDETTIRKISQQATKADYKFDPYMNKEKLSSYLNYCRKLEPKFTNEAGDIIQNFWVKAKLHSLKLKSGEGIKIEPRHLHGLIRLTFAFAKLHLREEVLPQDAESAIGIFKRSLLTLGQDVETGELKQGVLTPTPKENKELAWKRITNELASKNPNGVIEPIDLIDAMIKSGKFDEYNAKEWITKDALKGTTIINTWDNKYKLSK